MGYTARLQNSLSDSRRDRKRGREEKRFVRATVSKNSLHILPLILTFAVTYQLHAQEQCRLSISNSPEIREVKLGMKFEDVLAKFPDSISLKYAPKADDAGLVDSVALGPLDWYKKADEFKGVKTIVLSFLDGSVSKIGIAYDESTSWPSIEEFTSQISKTLSLPQAWRNPTNADPKHARVMDCNGFRIIASNNVGGNGFIGLVDKTAEKIIADRRAANEEKKRQSFSP